MRFAAFDIETGALEASYGRLLCCCFKFFDEPNVRSVVVPHLRDEPRALREISSIMREANVLVSWNGKRFDVPFLNAMCLARRRDPMPVGLHLDLLPHHRHYFRTRGHRLDGVQKDLATPSAKHDVPASDWKLALDGNAAALRRIVKHCEHDVRITQEVCMRMAPYIKNITR